MRLLGISPLAVLLLTGACAYTHPTKTADDFRRDREDCQNTAQVLSVTRVPRETLTASSGARLQTELYARILENCLAQRGWTRGPQKPVPPGLPPDPDKVWASLDDAGAKAFEQADYAAAQRHWDAALKEAEGFGANDPRLGMSLSALASVYAARGQYAEAEPLYRRSLPILEAFLGPKHPDVERVLMSLARLYHAQSRYADAEREYRRVLAIRESVLGREHRLVAESLDTLGMLALDQGEAPQAEAFFRQALAIQETVLGPEHADLGRSLTNLASLLSTDHQRVTEAEALTRRAVAIREAALGPDHPDVAQSLNTLAEIHRAQGRRAEAMEAALRALAIRTRALGYDHPDTAASLTTVALFHHAEGRHEQAAGLLRDALDVYESPRGNLPPNHPGRADVLEHLARVYRALGKMPEADAAQARAAMLRTMR